MSYKLYTTRDTVTGAITRDGVSVSGAGEYRSEKFTVSPNDSFGLTLESTGTLAGTWELQFTDEENPDVTTDDDWEADASVALTAPAGAPIKDRYPIGNARARFGRVKFTYTSGSGVIKATVA